MMKHIYLQARKSRVRLTVVDKENRPIQNATVSLAIKRAYFPLGCAINQNILQNQAYQNWFASRFRYTVFENELKWYSTERSRGSEDYSVPNALMNFARSRGIAVRGHNIFWEDPRFQPGWVPGLSSAELNNSASRRIASVTRQYRGQLIHWDVMNENLHYNFFESRLGSSASVYSYLRANRDDPKAVPFLNEYNTIEESGDGVASPARYLQMVYGLRNRGYKGPLGIGLEGHFRYANLPYTRAGIDMLASAKLPIWVTELDVRAGQYQAGDLDKILREVHSHWAVGGIMLWSAWSPRGCYQMCLTDNNFRNLPTGDVVDRFSREVIAPAEATTGTTGSDGVFEASLFHGEYEAKITHPDGQTSSQVKTINVAPDQEQPTVFQFDFHV